MNDYNNLLPLQRALTDMLSFFDSFCKKNKIKYFLAAGTALGAYRHKGFIPWDDDVDVMLTFGEFQKLVLSCERELSINSEYYLDNDYTKKNNPLFSKFRKRNTTYIDSKAAKYIDHNELFLDIFVLYASPDSKKEQKKQFRRAKEFTFLSTFNYSKHKFYIFSFLIYIILLPFKNVIYHNITKYETLSTSTYSTLFVYLPMVVFPKKIFSETSLASFNNLYLPLPKDINLFLENQFGPTYNQLPPVENRKPHHILYLNLKKGLSKNEIVALLKEIRKS